MAINLPEQKPTSPGLLFNYDSSGSKKIIALLFFLLAAALVFYFSFYPSIKKNSQKPVVTNYEQCVAAGYPVMQSYPPQCTMPGGKFFVQQVMPER